MQNTDVGEHNIAKICFLYILIKLYSGLVKATNYY